SRSPASRPSNPRSAAPRASGRPSRTTIETASPTPGVFSWSHPTMRALCILPALLFCSSALAEAPRLTADIVLPDGKIWTGEHKRPEAAALAVRDGRVVALGTSADIKGLAGPKTRVIALGGKRVVPGFIDSHVHMLGSGMRLAQVALK